MDTLSRPKKIKHRSRESLTPREREVVGLVVLGLTNIEMAEQLVVSLRTIDTHLSNIRGKLGLRNKTEIAMWAINQAAIH